MQLETIREFVREDLDIVDHIIADYLGSDITLIRQLGEHIFGSGGKRLRPTLVLLGAYAFNYAGDHHRMLAGIVELIHTATLLHDDVVDSSSLRRGKETANNIWGNEASVLVGDYVYSRAFQMMVSIGNMSVLSVLANAANMIAEGEVMQLMNCRQSEATEAQYMLVIERKTATLFSAAAQLGAILCDRSQNEIQALANYGLHLGIAFQLVDDALDYGASDEDIGKNVGDDLAEGKPTIPLIYALEKGTPAQAELIRTSINEGCIENLGKIKEAIESTQAITYTYQLAKQHRDIAIKQLELIPASQAKDVMCGLADFAVNRKY